MFIVLKCEIILMKKNKCFELMTNILLSFLNFLNISEKHNFIDILAFQLIQLLSLYIIYTDELKHYNYHFNILALLLRYAKQLSTFVPIILSIIVKFSEKRTFELPGKWYVVPCITRILILSWVNELFSMAWQMLSIELLFPVFGGHKRTWKFQHIPQNTVTRCRLCL